MIAVHTFLNVRMASGPNLDITLFSYGETPDHGRWMLKNAAGVPVDLAEVHNSERSSRRSELQTAINAYFGFTVNLHDLTVRATAGSQADNMWPNTWSKP